MRIDCLATRRRVRGTTLPVKGHGVEQAKTGAPRGDAARPAAWSARARCVQGGEAARAAKLGSQRLRRGLLRRRPQRRIRDHRGRSRRATSRCGSPRERGACRLKDTAMRAGFERILVPIAAELIAGGPAGLTSPATASVPARCSTRWRTGSSIEISATPSTARARFARRSRIAPARSRKARRTCGLLPTVHEAP